MANYHLAQINIAKFYKPRAHANNRDFYAAIDAVNEAASKQKGFIWRWSEDDLPVAIKLWRDPRYAINMSVWESLEALGAFAYRQSDHKAVFTRKEDWFEPLETYLALWWVPEGHRPTIEEGKAKLDYLAEHGPSADAFTFRQRFAPPA